MTFSMNRTYATVAFVLLSLPLPLASQEVMQYDFRQGRIDERLFRYDGPTPGRYIAAEAEGLHWRFTQGQAPTKPVGIYWNARVPGDFVVTAHYEILHVNRAGGGIGVGPEIYLMLDNPARDGIIWARVLDPSDRTLLAFSYRSADAAGKRISKASERYPTTQSSERGRLRVAREGSFLVLSLAENETGEFKQFYRGDVGTEPVRMIRFAGVTGGNEQAGLDMRLLEFQLQTPAVVDPRPTRGAHYAFWLLLLALVVPLILFMILRQRKRTER
jgi:hypothetical protein